MKTKKQTAKELAAITVKDLVLNYYQQDLKLTAKEFVLQHYPNAIAVEALENPADSNGWRIVKGENFQEPISLISWTKERAWVAAAIRIIWNQ